MDEPTTTPTDNSATPKPSENPSTAPVMDVKPPIPASPLAISTPVDDVSMASEETAPSPGSSVTPASSSDLHTPPESPDSVPPASTQTTHVQKGKGKMIKVLLIIVIAAALIGAAVYFYLKNKDDTQVTDASKTTATETTATAPANIADVTATTKAVDDAMTQADAAKDLDGADLTDSTLGL